MYVMDVLKKSLRPPSPWSPKVTTPIAAEIAPWIANSCPRLRRKVAGRELACHERATKLQRIVCIFSITFVFLYKLGFIPLIDAITE
jgi:hypothetical protein